MTGQHRATLLLELRARVEALEAKYETQRLATLKRIMALKAGQQPRPSDVGQSLRQPSPATIAECVGPCEQGFEHCDCGLLEQLNPGPAPSPAVDRVRDLQDRIRDGSLTLAEALAEIGAPTPAPAPADSLVERVVKVIADPDGPPELWHDEARAAILVVAEWLDERDTSIKDDLEAPFAEDCIVDDAIRWLQQEANQ